MFSTSLAVAALSGLLATGSLSGSANWQTDYRTALKLSADQQKPLVVVIHAGGANQAFREPTISKDALNAVRQSYIALSVDPKTEQGRQLAEMFKMQQGLIISDKSGKLQALRYEGNPNNAEMSNYLTRFANSVQAPAQTEYVYQPGLRPTASYPTYYSNYPAGAPSQPGLFQQPGPINNLITRPVSNVFNATRSLVIGGG